ncbi:MAG: tRNA epoxyqueuosine(34) reductase QueG [Spirochaetales bacterium]|nr:tRNA epoxyqueuosine(34) reductase QueG [Spirochaetales bacterium]
MRPPQPYFPQVDTQLARPFAEQGLVLLGTASASEGDDTLEAQKFYQGWLSENKHGEMDWLVKHAPMKYSPQVLEPRVKSVLVAALPYFQERPRSNSSEGIIARYAWGKDYHKVFLAKLRKVAEALQNLWQGEYFRAFTDTSPLDERFWAQRAGLAFTGRNSLSITGAWGSWFFLGEILSSKEFTPTKAPVKAHGACPSGCHRCSSSCPTGALQRDGGIDARRCIAYLTIEHRGPIPHELRPLMGNWIFGCDICQEVCPFNLGISPTPEKEFLKWHSGPELSLQKVLSIPDEKEFTKLFGGSPVHRPGFSGLRRNACIVAANLQRVDLLPILDALRYDKDPVVAEAASWAIQILQQSAVHEKKEVL